MERILAIAETDRAAILEQITVKSIQVCIKNI